MIHWTRLFGDDDSERSAVEKNQLYSFLKTGSAPIDARDSLRACFRSSKVSARSCGSYFSNSENKVSIVEDRRVAQLDLSWQQRFRDQL